MWHRGRNYPVETVRCDQEDNSSPGNRRSKPVKGSYLEDRTTDSTTSFCVHLFICSSGTRHLGRTTQLLSDRIREHFPIQFSTEKVRLITGVICRIVLSQPKTVICHNLNVSETVRICSCENPFVYSETTCQRLELSWPTCSFSTTLDIGLMVDKLTDHTHIQTHAYKFTKFCEHWAWHLGRVRFITSRRLTPSVRKQFGCIYSKVAPDLTLTSQRVRLEGCHDFDPENAMLLRLLPILAKLLIFAMSQTPLLGF